MLYRAAVIGDSQTVMGFKAVGLTTVAVSEEWEPTSSKNSDPVFRGVTVSWQERPACKRKKVAD